MAALVVVSALLLSACASPAEPEVNQVAVQPLDPDGAYCQAVLALLIAQPSGAFEDEELSRSMDFYADSVERLAELSSTDDAVVLFELAGTARRVGADPNDRVQAQRLASMFAPAGAITIRATQACGIAN